MADARKGNDNPKPRAWDSGGTWFPACKMAQVGTRMVPFSFLDEEGSDRGGWSLIG